MAFCILLITPAGCRLAVRSVAVAKADDLVEEAAGAQGGQDLIWSRIGRIPVWLRTTGSCRGLCEAVDGGDGGSACSAMAVSPGPDGGLGRWRARRLRAGQSSGRDRLLRSGGLGLADDAGQRWQRGRSVVSRRASPPASWSAPAVSLARSPFLELALGDRLAILSPICPFRQDNWTWSSARRWAGSPRRLW